MNFQLTQNTKNLIFTNVSSLDFKKSELKTEVEKSLSPDDISHLESLMSGGNDLQNEDQINYVIELLERQVNYPSDFALKSKIEVCKEDLEKIKDQIK